MIRSMTVLLAALLAAPGWAQDAPAPSAEKRPDELKAYIERSIAGSKPSL